MKFLKTISFTLLILSLGSITACGFNFFDKDTSTERPENSVQQPSTGNDDNSSGQTNTDNGDNSSGQTNTGNDDNSSGQPNTGNESLLRVSTQIPETYSTWFDIDWTGSGDYIKKGVEITATVSFACNNSGELIAPAENTYDGLIIISGADGEFLYKPEQTEGGWTQQFTQGGANGINQYPSFDITWSYSFTVPTDFEGDGILIAFIPAINGKLAT